MSKLALGMLISIEGIDGSGKSTLACNLAEKIQKHCNHSVMLTKEPGGSALGKKLRTILQTQPFPITPIAEFLLFAADRAQHMQQMVKPALEQGTIVISDRMADSSLAYQGYGRGIDKYMIQKVNQWAMQNIKPNIIFYLRINPDIAAQRLQSRTDLTAFEKEQVNFVERLIAGFDKIFQNNQSVVMLDGTQTSEEITATALAQVCAQLELLRH